MAEITDTAAIAFVNERLRPDCEILRAFVALANDLEAAHTHVQATFTANAGADTLNRENVPELTGSEVETIVSAMITARNTLENAAVAWALVNKACVRPLSIVGTP